LEVLEAVTVFVEFAVFAAVAVETVSFGRNRIKISRRIADTKEYGSIIRTKAPMDNPEIV